MSAINKQKLAKACAEACAKVSVKSNPKQEWKKGSMTPLDRLKNATKESHVVENFDIAELLPMVVQFNNINNTIGYAITQKNKKIFTNVNNRNRAMEEYCSKNADLMSVLEIVSFISTTKGFYKIVDSNGDLTGTVDWNFSGIIRQTPHGAKFDDHNSGKIIAHLKNERFCKEFNSLFHEIVSQKNSAEPDLKVLILLINNSLNRGFIGTVINILSKVPKRTEGIFAKKHSWDIVPELKEMNDDERTPLLFDLLKSYEDIMSYFSFIFFTSAMELITPSSAVVEEVVEYSETQMNEFSHGVSEIPPGEIPQTYPTYTNSNGTCGHTYQSQIVLLVYDGDLCVPKYLNFNRILLEFHPDVILSIPFYSSAENPSHIIGFSPRNGRVDFQLVDQNNGYVPTYSDYFNSMYSY